MIDMNISGPAREVKRILRAAKLGKLLQDLEDIGPKQHLEVYWNFGDDKPLFIRPPAKKKRRKS